MFSYTIAKAVARPFYNVAYFIWTGNFPSRLVGGVYQYWWNKDTRVIW